MHAKGRKFPAPAAIVPHRVTRIPNRSQITRFLFMKKNLVTDGKIYSCEFYD
jgi:hypothetical protein